MIWRLIHTPVTYSLTRRTDASAVAAIVSLLGNDCGALVITVRRFIESQTAAAKTELNQPAIHHEILGGNHAAVI